MTKPEQIALIEEHISYHKRELEDLLKKRQELTTAPEDRCPQDSTLTVHQCEACCEGTH